MSHFISDRYAHHPVSMDDVVVIAGSASAINSMMFTLCEDGDSVLCIYKVYILFK